MVIERAIIDDLVAILVIQKLAYVIQAKIYDDYNIMPLTETLDDFKVDFENKAVYKAVIDSQIVGAVRVLTDETTCHIGKLCVLPQFHGKGIGTKLLKEVEKIYKYYNRFELFAGSKSVDNIRLYERFGYKKFKTVPYIEGITVDYMEKLR